MAEATITYVESNNVHPYLDDVQVLGGYKVEYADGIKVMVPHSGRLHTVGATPLNTEDPEERSILLQIANEARHRLIDTHGVDTPGG